MAALTPNSIRLCSLALGVALALAPPALAADVSLQLDAGTGFSVKNSTGATERLRIDEATGNISRNGALFVHTTGANSTFVGARAGSTSTTGAFNTAVGFNTLYLNTTGDRNSAVGKDALHKNTTGRDNSAVGYRALYSNTTGYRNSAVGQEALYSNTTGFWNSAVGYRALRSNTEGVDNNAFGVRALGLNTAGNSNSAVGRAALYHNTTGNNNNAVGVQALYHNTTGNNNNAVGYRALVLNYTGSNGSAFGYQALHSNDGGFNSAFGSQAIRYNTTGGSNSAVGYAALRSNTTGNRNVAVGRNAGINQTTGSDNIYLANVGVAAESGQIRIGTYGTHTQATIQGIFTKTSTSGLGVYVNSSGTLGTTTSSASFKEDVNDMGDASNLLAKLRPVTFHYKKEIADGDDTLQYGLIAEEVAEVAPDLVVTDAKGKPYSVRYRVLAPMLLNEAQKQQHMIERQQKVIAELSSRLALLEDKAESDAASKKAIR